MANAQSTLTKTVRYGIESVRGTGVACTAIMDIADADWDVVPPLWRSGNLTGGVFQSGVVGAGVLVPRLRVKLGSINWDKWQRFLACGVDGGITAAGAGADKVWGSGAIKPPQLSTGGAVVEALKSLTLEYGYANPAAAQPAHKMVGAVVERIKVDWNGTGPVTAEIDFVATATPTDITAYSGTLSADTMSAAVPDFSMLKVYVDDTTIGTTQDTTVVSASLEWKSFMAVDENAKRLAIGKYSEWTASFRRFAEAADMLAASRTKAEKKVRIASIGPVLGSTTWELAADLYATVESRPLGELSGFLSEEVTLAPRRDATATTDIAFRLTNSVAVV